MENKLSCAVVRDLLPLYADELVSDETRAEINGHLETCPACSAVLRDIRPEAGEPEAERKRVDFLKKVRTRGRKRTAVTTIIGILLALLGISLIYFRGTVAQSADAICRTQVDGSTVTLVMKAASDTQRISRVDFTSANGIVNVIVRTTPKLFFSNEEKEYSYTLVGFEVTQVHIGNTVLWQGGREISEKASRLYTSANPFVGDMPADTRIADALGVRTQFGAYTNELHTEKPPYGWTLVLKETVPAPKETLASDLMRADACVFLALIENLDTVTWEYPTEQGTETLTFTAEDASALCGGEVKDFVRSASDMQTLLELLGLD